MSKSSPANLAASVRQRLLNLSRDRGEDFNLVLTRYAIERFLFRLTKSPYVDRFVLKGATLFALWTGRAHRPTRDLDLLGYGDSSGKALAKLFKDICTMDVEPDGLDFDPNSVQVAEIREVQEYGGQRVKLVGMLGNARISLQIDIGFGDVVTPAPEEVDYPTLLAFPAPRIRAYPKESVIAEKLQAMVALGIANSRMRDFYDVWMMSRAFEFGGSLLARAIKATFERRGTEIPIATPLTLTAEFAGDPDKVRQWAAFLQRSGLGGGNVEFAWIIGDLRTFLISPLSAAASGVDFHDIWPAGGPWVAKGPRL